ncbi:MAG TPA: low temperature requirement protein A [Vicinamibacterales bacterium]|nr:low temperature requirement protein A [Vicinamibacterales bacterium]
MQVARAASDRKVTWTELFFDLVFVAAVAQVGAPLAADYSFGEVGRFAFLLLIIWWAWHGYAVYATRFDTDDAVERGATLLQMVAVVFMAANAEQGLDSTSSAGFAAAYAVMRFILVGRYLRAAARSGASTFARHHAIGFGLAATAWLLSSIAPTPLRYGLWIVALAIDLGTGVTASRHTIAVPPHASHLPERFGLFTLILFGEAMVAIMNGIQHQPTWSVAAAGTALSGIASMCAVWWIYFDGVDAAGHRPVHCQADSRRLGTWSAAHVPLYLGVALFGMANEHAVRQGGWQQLHGEETVLAWSGVVLICGALGVLYAERRTASRAGRRT